MFDCVLLSLVIVLCWPWKVIQATCCVIATDAGIVEAVEAAGLKLPSNSNPGSRTGSIAGSRTTSRAGSIRSQSSVATFDTASNAGTPRAGKGQSAGRPGSSAGRIATVKTMQFGS